MQLYLVCGSEVENFDWFVLAHGPVEAAKLWREHEMVKDFRLTEPKAVWSIPADPINLGKVPRVLEWDEEVKDVTP